MTQLSHFLHGWKGVGVWGRYCIASAFAGEKIITLQRSLWSSDVVEYVIKNKPQTKPCSAVVREVTRCRFNSGWQRYVIYCYLCCKSLVGCNQPKDYCPGVTFSQCPLSGV